jgi:Ni/Co efflux regulator RcnB
MNPRSTGLALLLLASTATSAFAQEGHGRWGRGPQSRTLPAASAAPQPAAPPVAREAPRAREPRSWRGGDPQREGVAGQPRPRELPSAEGARRNWNPGDGARRDWNQRRGEGPGVVRPGEGADRARRDGHDARPGRDAHDRARPDGDRFGHDRNWTVDRAPGDRSRLDRDRDRDRERGRGWDGDRRDRQGGVQVWRQGRYPPSYNAHARFRGHVWRPPPGYYVRSWRYGEYLPGGWYAESYWLTDWWAYDLPEPPYGYEWVRVGSDAVLVDTFSGRIVQVVRLLFW